ncbi:MAG: hypothetical protein NTX50_29145 [Candidatus Sumerlaeota bacterium]|nr:hypothetical protein [Candidatus Sumerlaeota bacterium]
MGAGGFFFGGVAATGFVCEDALSLTATVLVCDVALSAAAMPDLLVGADADLGVAFLVCDDALSVAAMLGLPDGAGDDLGAAFWVCDDALSVAAMLGLPDGAGDDLGAALLVCEDALSEAVLLEFVGAAPNIAAAKKQYKHGFMIYLNMACLLSRRDGMEIAHQFTGGSGVISLLSPGGTDDS